MQTECSGEVRAAEAHYGSGCGNTISASMEAIIPADREIPSVQIIERAVSSQSSAYDCEYVVLAQMLHLKQVSRVSDRAGIVCLV